MIKTKYNKGMDAKWLAAALEDCTLKMAETKTEDKAALPADEHNDGEEFGLIDYFKMYLERSEFNDWHRQAQTSILHRLQRYEKWLGYNNGNPDFRLSLELFDKEQVEDYADYMEHEHEYRDVNRKFFDQFNIKNEKWIRPISRNGIISGIKRLLFAGYIDAATAMSESSGGGGSAPDSGWGRDKDDDEEWARRCAQMATRMSATKPKYGYKRR